MQLTKHRWLWIALLCFTSFAACKKNTEDVPAPESSTPVTGGAAEADKLKDTALLYAKDIYLWYKQIPSTFNARSYSDLNKIMEGIRPYSIEPGFSTAVDRWALLLIGPSGIM